MRENKLLLFIIFVVCASIALTIYFNRMHLAETLVIEDVATVSSNRITAPVIDEISDEYEDTDSQFRVIIFDSYNNNIRIISESIDAERRAIEIIVINMMRFGVKEIIDLTIETDSSEGWSIIFTDSDDRIYYSELNKDGVLLLLRKDNNEGEIIYPAFED